MRTFLINCFFVSLVLHAGPCTAADDSRLEARKRAREAEVERAGVKRALSKEMPQPVKDLPIFGEIEWAVEAMPFVERGPHAGISGMGMVVVDGQIYLVGGFIPAGDETQDSGRRTSRWAQCYDPKTSRWTRLPDLPARREYTRAVAGDSVVYVLGGGAQGNPFTPSADVFQLDVSRIPLQWQTMASLTVPRTHMAVGRAGSHLIVAGGNRYDFAEKGYSARTIQGVTDVFNLARPQLGWKQAAPIPGSPRGWAASVALGGRLYVFGGVTFTEDGPRARLQEALTYDPAQDKWMRLADPPLAVSGWQGAAYRDRFIIVVGGAAKNWNDVPFVYDTRTGRWMRAASPLPPGGLFNDPGVVIIGDTIYVAGGEGPGGSHFNHFLIGKIHSRLDDAAR